MKPCRLMRVNWLRFGPALPPSVLPGLSDEPDLTYAQRLERVLADRPLYFSGFQREMTARGYEVIEILADVFPLQACWARENGVRFVQTHWSTDILLAQIEKFRPELLYLQAGPFALPVSLRRHLRRLFPFIRRVVVSQAMWGYYDDYGDIDLLLAGSPLLDEAARRHGVRSRLVYHGFDESVRDVLASEPPGAPAAATFSGVSGWNERDAHDGRLRLLSRLLDEDLIEAWVMEEGQSEWSPIAADRPWKGRLADGFSYLCLRGFSGAFRPLRGRLRDELWYARLALEQRLRGSRGTALPGGTAMAPLTYRFPTRCHPPVFGLDMYRLCARSRVSVNVHGDTKPGYVDNIRLFEATGMGSCLLTDGGRNLPDLFEPDREVATYAGVEECMEKIRYLLDHETVRREMAAAGQKRTLRDHTVARRCEQIDAAIRELP